MSGARGRGLVSERINRLPNLLRDQLAAPLPSLPADLQERGLVTTGVGSSEAAARYAAHLFSERGLPVRFLSYSQFYSGITTEPDPPYLMLFTQGLSPNAEIVLGKRKEFAGLLLVSSSSVAGQRDAEKPERAEWLETLQEEGATLLRHPMENEYEILPRFIGPVCVMAEVCRIVESVFPGSIPDMSLVPDLFTEMIIPEVELSAGSGFFFTNDSLHYAQNLSCKVLETLMIPAPFLADALTYSHGPFQVNVASPVTNILFSGPDSLEEELVSRLKPLFEKVGPVHVVKSPVSAPLAIFHYESFLNLLLEQALVSCEVDLVDWPGKGEDGEGYGIRGPL